LVVGVLDALFFQLMLLLGRNIIFYDVLDGRGELMPLTINPQVKNRVIVHLCLNVIGLLKDGTHS